MLKEQLTQDLKAALLSGDKERATIIRGLKSVILYAEVAEGKREQGLDDQQIIVLFAKEVKKRLESAELYEKGGKPELAQKELAEKAVIEAYLPAQMSDEELRTIIDTVLADFSERSPQVMGQVISRVKAETEGSADGSRIATMVKERLNN